MSQEKSEKKVTKLNLRELEPDLKNETWTFDENKKEDRDKK